MQEAPGRPSDNFQLVKKAGRVVEGCTTVFQVCHASRWLDLLVRADLLHPSTVRVLYYNLWKVKFPKVLGHTVSERMVTHTQQIEHTYY